MEHTNRPKPENVLRLSELDVNLVQALSKHWVVTVEQQGNEVLLELYPYVDEPFLFCNFPFIQKEKDVFVPRTLIHEEHGEHLVCLK